MNIKIKPYIIITRWIVLVALYTTVLSVFWNIQEALLILVEFLIKHPLSMVLFFCLYLIRPFTLIPVGRLSTISGVFWWLRPGLVLWILWEMMSASIAFWYAKKLTRESLTAEQEKPFSTLHFILLKHPFWAVVLSRFSPLPDDVINYGRWIIHIARPYYFWWSLLGNIPFTVLNIALWSQIDPVRLLTQGIHHAIERSTFLPLLIVYSVCIVIGSALYRRIAQKS